MSETYTPEERVLCYHGPVIYEAKILDVRSKDGDTEYHVHYKGWKKGWDEWIGPERLLKFSTANQAKAKELMSLHNASPGAPRGRPPKDSSGTYKKKDSGTRGTKRRRDDDGEKKLEMKLTIPDTLKKQLVRDYELVKNEHILRLPRNPSIRTILQDFEDYLVQEKPPNLEQPQMLASTITSGLLTYFEKFCATNLLYRFERQQFAEMKAHTITGQHVVIGQEKLPSDWYGAEHLLRLLVAMPNLTTSASMDRESMLVLRDYINEFFAYIERREDEVFDPEAYHTPSDYYIKLANTP